MRRISGRCGVVFGLMVVVGCGFTPLPVSNDAEGPINVVITFDDGPLSADTADTDSLLTPLQDILATLKSYGVQSVFYVKGPGTAERGEQVKTIFADGLRAIKNDGHVLGYHAYNHDVSVWEYSLTFGLANGEAMKRDLQELKTYVDSAAGPEISLSPIFRQPYGGGAIRWIEGLRVAGELGLTFHGFVIDSFDWTGNLDADPNLIARMPVDTDENHLAMIQQRFKDEALEHRNDETVDILFHVNHFTARYLGQMLDALKTSFFESSGREVVFTVPEEYLNQSNPWTDMAILEFMF